jgi:hypothetical protein
VSLDGAADRQHEEAAPSWEGERISIDQMRDLARAGENVIVIDARSERTYAESNLHAGGAVRLDPNNAAREAQELGLPKDAWPVVFCA